MFRRLAISTLALGLLSVPAETLQSLIDQTMTDLNVTTSEVPYSRSIEKILLGYNAKGKVVTGISIRKIDSFESITGIVIIHKTPRGFILHQAHFPDIGKIKNAKDRNQVLTVLKQFQNIPFDPHVEKSAVDSLSSATRYGIQTSGYLNYMARQTALEMEAHPIWTQKKHGL